VGGTVGAVILAGGKHYSIACRCDCTTGSLLGDLSSPVASVLVGRGLRSQMRVGGYSRTRTVSEAAAWARPVS
jgi:hypothetical protein